MLNSRPIFLLGFQHGGSNIVLNLLRSHPDVCSPRGELQEVFKGKGFPRRFREPASVVISKLWNYLPVILEQREDVFSLNTWRDRRAFSVRTMKQIDMVLALEKLKARGDTQNKYRTEGIEYSDEEIRYSRLLCKNLNGLVYLSRDFHSMYPDATFIALVRNGFALCEGHVRRGADLLTVANWYENGCRKMIADAREIPNYHIFRFEDLLQNPQEEFARICRAADLDMGQIDKIRLENKKIIDKKGRHAYMYESNREGLIWYPLDMFMNHFKGNVNRHQIDRLDREQKRLIREVAGESLKHFSYL